MKKLALGFLFIFLLAGCEKEKNTTPTEKEKHILEVRAAAEYPLGLKATDLYIGVEYYKDYTEKDVVTVSINNGQATLISEVTENDQLSTQFASKSLFKLPQINQTGDVKINISIKNNQNTISGEGTIRVVNDYSLSTVWNSLDRTYLNTRYFYANRLKNNSFILQQVGFSNTNDFFLGFYSKNFGNFNTYEDRTFIPGLSGRYTLSFNGNTLNHITTNNGDKIIDQNFNVDSFYATLTAIYGAGIIQPQTNNNKVTIFKSAGFQLVVTETPREVSTVITQL